MPKQIKALILLIALPVLGGCVQDTASYLIEGDRNHAVTLARSQKWFWDSRVTVAVIAARQPACLGGLNIEAVPRTAAMALYRAPDEYPEPLFILAAETAHYAISTQSCKVQKFTAAPTDLGQKLGTFAEEGGRFHFVPTQP